MVHPDVDYTKKQKTQVDNPGLKENPFNKHFHENNLESMLEQMKMWSDLPFKIIDNGFACQYWSFYLIIEKL